MSVSGAIGRLLATYRAERDANGWAKADLPE